MVSPPMCGAFVARFSLQRVCVVLVMHSHPLIAHMSHEVQCHRPAFPNASLKKKKIPAVICSVELCSFVVNVGGLRNLSMYSVSKTRFLLQNDWRLDSDTAPAPDREA